MLHRECTASQHVAGPILEQIPRMVNYGQRCLKFTVKCSISLHLVAGPKCSS